MKQIRPYKVLLFTLGVMLLLAPVVLTVPEDGWNIGGMKLRFMTAEQFLHPVKQQKADISKIVQHVDTSMIEDDPLLQHQNKSGGNLGTPKGGQISAESETFLELDENGLNNLHAFFEKITAVAENKEKISILHYGDSQIEGDRMTNHIRQRLQNQFGGYGPGLIPATNVYNTNSFNQTYSENFMRYACFYHAERLISKKYGAMGSASRFTPEYNLDQVNLDELKEQTGWIILGASDRAYSRAKQFNNVILHYNDCKAKTLLKVYENEKLIHEDTLIVDGGYHTLPLSFEATPGELKFEFTGKVSPNICGFSLDGDFGVQMANIGMRGSSGTFFGKIDHATLRPMYEELNTKLVILQFGGNAIPYFTDSSKVVRFAGFFKSQIQTVKRLNPGCMVVVIGPSDMSELVAGIHQTYKFLPYCVEQMKKVTMESGGAYWDLYTAMGGLNSMPAWVEQNLAAKDYIHFSNGGVKIASQMFYLAFIAEYAKWKEMNP